MRQRPRQLALALDHAESFAREDFLAGPSNAGGARADRALAGLAEPHDAAGRAGRLRQEPSGGDLGAGGGRALRRRRARSTAPTCRRRSRPARWWSRICADGRFDERALFHLLNLAREESGLSCCSRRGRRRRAGRIAVPDLASRLRALPVVALAPPDDALLRAVIVKLFADRQLAGRREPGRLSRDPHRALVRRRPGGGRRARPRGAAPATAPGHPGAGRGAVSRALTLTPGSRRVMSSRVTMRRPRCLVPNRRIAHGRPQPKLAVLNEENRRSGRRRRGPRPGPT